MNEQTLQDEKTTKVNGDMVHVMSVVTLPHVTKSDAGNLTCITINKVGKNTAIISLRVAGKSKLSRVHQHRHLGAGTDVDVITHYYTL